MTRLYGCHIAALILASALTLPLPALADFQGKVTGVSAGDIISVMREGRAVRVRLAGIDCPEKSQPFGKNSREFTTNLVSGKTVKVREKTIDQDGRLVAGVILADGFNLNRELVRAGLAWWDRKYAPQDPILKAFEREARKARRGLWAGRSPIPPWE